MSTFFISDLHLGHENMAIKRGFSCADEMNDTIIKRWNSVVSKRDLVICTGDITMEKTKFYPLLNELNGLKTIVLGNHDEPNHVPELLKYVNKVAGMIDYKKEFILTHCPIHPSQLDYRYKYNIHGHIHSEFIDDPRYINICAENIDYTPKTLEQLLNLNKLK
jgi:calcineurin-like phosphoesterase family protein